ncbi:hypothetical protein FHL15_008885 [Xylaria flabelliformis]|uniref:Uncharacterized protein n=1 Tax=Xylaria flabelliformis TaxID=2512241 RepID=A0A553HQD6_9PEZI|nr:hypothetical protein FHL15_008885 [Xylaria flabelliformis]
MLMMMTPPELASIPELNIERPKERESKQQELSKKVPMLDSFLSGATFGAALAATGMYQPSVILSQMRLENWHMVQTFLTASGASTLIVTLCQKLGYLQVKPRNYSSLGLLGPLDGNIIGGCLLGIGMTLSGSCPGTVFAQVGAGVRSGFYTLGGCLLGGVIWSCFLRPVLASIKLKSRVEPPKPEYLTIQGALGISQAVAVVGVGAIFAGAVAAISALGLVKTQGLVDPVLGGFLIAGSQLFSALARKTLLGTSASFEEYGDYVSWLVKGGGDGKPKSYSSTVVVTGVTVGALGLSLLAPLPQMPPAVDINTTRLVLGGVLLAIGSRMGGGCTSGHGITGISLLSVSSFVTVAAMFVGAFGSAAFL